MVSISTSWARRSRMTSDLVVGLAQATIRPDLVATSGGGLELLERFERIRVVEPGQACL